MGEPALIYTTTVRSSLQHVYNGKCCHTFTTAKARTVGPSALSSLHYQFVFTNLAARWKGVVVRNRSGND